MHRSRFLLPLICGLGALTALAFIAPALIVVAVVALPITFAFDRLLALAAPLWADLASWTIGHLSRPQATETHAAPDLTTFPAPQTGRPEITAFA